MVYFCKHICDVQDSQERPDSHSPIIVFGVASTVVAYCLRAKQFRSIRSFASLVNKNQIYISKLTKYTIGLFHKQSQVVKVLSTIYTLVIQIKRKLTTVSNIIQVKIIDK